MQSEMKFPNGLWGEVLDAAMGQRIFKVSFSAMRPSR
jgi:hypothetical protein